MKLQEIIQSIEMLSIEEQDYLLEFLHQKRIEQRRQEIAANTEALKLEFQQGTANRGTIHNLIDDLLEDESESSLQPRTPGLLSGKLSDTFFDPLPEEELQQ